jgi:dienelactone hydrolase
MSIIDPEQIKVHTAGVGLTGDLAVPANATGIVIFAHGSGSSRLSPRNRKVAAELQRRGLATLLLDLLTMEEEAHDMQTAALRFDIDMLAPRLIAAIHMMKERVKLPIGLFGASTGAAVALVAAAHHPDDIAAVVSRGGRPDLAMSVLPKVRAATLLIIGGHDETVIQMNRQAFDHLECEKKIEIVPGATHLFEEPGALEKVAALAGDWFVAHLQAAVAV